MFKTLHGKLSAVLLGLLCLTGFLSLGMILLTARLYFWEVDQKVNQHLAADLTTDLAAKHLLRPVPRTQAKARAEIKELMAINPSVEVYVLDARGVILTYSVPPATVKRHQVSLAPLQRFLSGTSPLPILGDDPRDFHRQKVFSAAAFSSDGQTGYVYVILGGEAYDSVARLLGRSAILESSLATAVVVLLFILATGMLLFHLLTRRLRQLTQAMAQFQEDDVRQHAAAGASAEPLPQDEIDRLNLVYRQMSNRIQTQMQALTRADALRRELVGNVFHDLRTPLAALRGYLETLLMKEETLTPVQQREYLSIALRHGERLSALVTELFELARLDSHEAQLHPEPFVLAELVQDILQQFQLAADAKKVHLRFQVAEGLPFVFGEVGLIERVLDNLLENALHYTPEDGMITVTLMAHEDKVRVQVKDTGQGIPPEDLPHIFTRFYRVRNQADKPGGGGLGLAIAQRILELHGSFLTVESVPHEGTTFMFSLPTQAVLHQIS